MPRESDWEELRNDRYRRAWNLAALAVGIRPVKGISAKLMRTGMVTEGEIYIAYKRVLRNNLTGADDQERLRYVQNSENDGRTRSPKKTPTERMVDVVEFVRFAKLRGLPINDRMVAIANAFEPPKLTLLQDHQEPLLAETKKPPKLPSSELLTVGLLAMYIRKMALKPSAPPKSLLIGSKYRINVSELVKTLREDIEMRILPENSQAEQGANASTRRLRKVFGDVLPLLENVLEGSLSNFEYESNE